ncbi:MAG: hypothetical protein ACRDRH_30140 [Pseudonocardia sp.]
MDSIDSNVVVLTCADGARGRRFAVNGSPRPIPPPGSPVAGRTTVALPARPGRADIDPVLLDLAPRRVVVAGTDAVLAAVLLRLLRTDRLATEVAYVPMSRSSSAAAVWGLPRGRATMELAFDGAAVPVPLVRDDNGGVLVGRGELRDLRGECYCDNVLVLRGAARRLVVAPGPDGIAARAGRGGRLPDGRVRPVPQVTSGRGSAVGRAVQVGCLPVTVVSDGVAHPRAVERWTWYRHTADWLLVRP